MTKKIHSKKSFSMAVSLLMTFSLIAPGVATAETTGNLHQSVYNSNVIAKEKISDRLLAKVMTQVLGLRSVELTVPEEEELLRDVLAGDSHHAPSPASVAVAGGSPIDRQNSSSLRLRCRRAR